LKILVCKHAPQEGLGCLEELYPKLGIEYEYQELYHDLEPRSLTDYQGLVVMGGPMNVDQIQEYPFLKLDYSYIEKALILGLPMLGFCLGAQLLAKVLGAKVYKNPQPELGWYDLEMIAGADQGIFKGFPDHCKVFQWHGDTFELPQGAQLLASTANCKNQAFSWEENVYSLQFHLEVTATMIDEWLQDNATMTKWGFKPDPVKKATAQNIRAATALCSLLAQNFSAILR
jgi:GMP synthase (glutamine-hydrolysing)